MRPDLQLVRLMAAMIVTIIAYVAPSAVQAHEGHAHRGHQDVAVESAQAESVALQAPSKQATSKLVTSASSRSQATAGYTAVAAVGLIRSDEQGRGCCPGPCKGTCCGTMSCCVSGILASPASLPTLAFGQVVPVSRDVTGLPGVDPKTLPEPPRTLA